MAFNSLLNQPLKGLCQEFRKKYVSYFNTLSFYKMCDSGLFLGPAVQLLTLYAFKTEPLEQKLPMMTLLPPVQELLFKGRKSLEGSVWLAAKPKSFRLKGVH